MSNKLSLIQSLTTIAGENSQLSDEIAHVILRRVHTAPQEHKIPALYLLDSITKKVGEPYISAFAPRIVQCFGSTFENADGSKRRTLLKLLNTWPTFYPEEYQQLRTLVDNESPPPAPDPGDGRHSGGPVRLTPMIPAGITRSAADPQPGMDPLLQQQLYGHQPSPQQLLSVLSSAVTLSLIHISEPTRLLSISYAVFCLKKKKLELNKYNVGTRTVNR
eukprot:TRINITY_DN58315_c0_g1_i1.p1 TRINITY_DN58315_c0_g1~~TRINITY_DN58315_c0_g1_i1.p1  ORF type:complete len:219 (-),score=38.35 TRINITY_DN58315_c0_g1_i1:80-736(-)